MKTGMIALSRPHSWNTLSQIIRAKTANAGGYLEDSLTTYMSKEQAAGILVLSQTDEIPTGVLSGREDWLVTQRERFRQAL